MASPFVCPPVPCVEDQHVDAQPGRTGLDGVEPQHAADAFLHDVHQVGQTTTVLEVAGQLYASDKFAMKTSVGFLLSILLGYRTEDLV
ncbi:hypothetical protein MUK42_33889 [Musa troglodytarum]|uniref:Uncharacterized protein n=1 Tax=Musa troglodytarum TaxID=320322 RepID=A0A9E7GV95_9LILI|nr:hypothetical protein MUK42_33889 [Musa troglodytarum]